MTRRMRVSGWMVRAVRLFAVFIVAGVAVGSFALPRGATEMTILGDGRGAVQDAFDRADPGLAGRAGRMDVVLLRRAENLRHLPDIARLCRRACVEAITVIREMHLGGLRRRIVVDLSQFPGAEVIDTGATLPGEVAECIVLAVQMEVADVFGAPVPDCVPSHRRIWRLPFGL
ncbi:MAG: hypothetical protein AAGF30_11685 [Pseudomonadota bacterium]